MGGRRICTLKSWRVPLLALQAQARIEKSLGAAIDGFESLVRVELEELRSKHCSAKTALA